MINAFSVAGILPKQPVVFAECPNCQYAKAVIVAERVILCCSLSGLPALVETRFTDCETLLNLI